MFVMDHQTRAAALFDRLAAEYDTLGALDQP
jgi:hypothetical protein